jgi:transcriptional regulator with XRE-family HTH domain
MDATTKLRRWRTEAGYSLAEVAALTGYDASMFSRAERGERVFSTKARVVIARRLEVSIDDLFDLEEVSA